MELVLVIALQIRRRHRHASPLSPRGLNLCQNQLCPNSQRQLLVIYAIFNFKSQTIAATDRVIYAVYLWIIICGINLQSRMGINFLKQSFVFSLSSLSLPTRKDGDSVYQTKLRCWSSRVKDCQQKCSLRRCKICPFSTFNNNSFFFNLYLQLNFVRNRIRNPVC